MTDKNIAVDILNSCASSNALINNVDIADIKANDTRIDVRTVVGDEYPEMWIPKEHFKYEFPIDIYVAARISDKFDQVHIIGFIESAKVNKRSKNKNYYIVSASELKDISEIDKTISAIQPKQFFYGS